MARRRTDDKRQRILDAAVRVFAKKGYHGAKVAEIAKKAGVADGTIYLYFRDREDILVSLFDEVMEGAGPEAEHEVDRRRAIARVIEEAEPGDVVVIAGKGHEYYQVVVQEVRPFRDRAVVLDALGASA